MVSQGKRIRQRVLILLFGKIPKCEFVFVLKLFLSFIMKIREYVNNGDMDSGVPTPAYFCYHHAVTFKNIMDHTLHEKECSSLVAPYTCNLLARDGTMCGEVCQGGTMLYVHCFEKHGAHICVDCDYLTKNIDNFNYHRHFSLNGRQS